MTRTQKIMTNRFVTLLRGLIGGGIAGAVVWFALNGIVKINGQGWLERLNWPIPGWTIFMGVASVVGGIVGLLTGKQAQLRAQQLSVLGQKTGFTYSPSVTKTELGLDSSWFPNWHRGEHWLRWAQGESVIDMVDVTEVTQGSESHTTTKRTCFLSTVSGLPEFDLRPRHSGHFLFRAFGFGEMTFDASKANTAEQSRAIEYFNQHWHLTVNDIPKSRAGSRSASACEDAVRRLFTPTLMESLEGFRGWSARACGDRLVLWYGCGFAATETRESKVQVVSAFRDLLMAHVSLSTKDDPIIPPRPGDFAYARTQRTIAVTVGGVVGLFLGFFGGFGMFVSIEFDFDRPFALNAALFFAQPLAGAAIGCAVGAVLGRCCSRFVKIPRSMTDPRDAAIPVTESGGGWTIAGLFGGFTAGGLLSMVLMTAVNHFFGLNNLPFWLVAPLFFAFPIVGLLVGAFAGRRIGVRRASRRNRKQ